MIPDSLNPDQLLAFLKMARYCLGFSWSPVSADGEPYALPAEVLEVDNVDLLVLEGYAGTGKSYTINVLQEYVVSQKKLRFGMTAPTNKAVRVLKSASKGQGGPTFGTIHSFLGLKETTDYKTGVQSFKPGSEDATLRINSIDILVIDESSMLNEELFGYLYSHLEDGLKCIFMGDPRQIPPVGETQSIPFMEEMQHKYNMMVLMLNIIVRQQAGNPILEYATAIRNQITRTNIVHDLAESDKGTVGIEIIPRGSDVVESFLRTYFCTEEFKKNSDYIKVLAYRNSTVDYINAIIRKLIYGEGPLARIMIGEKLVVDKPIFRKVDGKEQIQFTTNEELEVLDVRVGFRNLEYTDLKGETISTSFKTYHTQVRVSSSDDIPTVIFILHETETANYAQYLENLVSIAKRAKEPKIRARCWRTYYSVQKEIANVKYNYCLTVHKSQGSTYDYAYVQEWDIATNRNVEERNRILYVATTRAKFKLFITK